MTDFKSLTFNITGEPGPLEPGSSLLGLSLSGRFGTLAGAAAVQSGRDSDRAWTIGDYFEAAAQFLHRKNTMEGMARAMGRPGTVPEDWQVSLFLEKHGAYYHPIRLRVQAEAGAKGQGSSLLVLNGAVAGPGLELMEKETGLLAHLGHLFETPVVPEVYARGEVDGPRGRAGFFLGNWFDGFHEFHITGAPGERQVVVWRPEGSDLRISLDQASGIYEQIARTLTLAYDIRSGNQIFPWHHAAGDFIVDPIGDTVDGAMPVRLITARGYEPLVDLDMENPLPGLFFFLLNLSLRMQLDRVDGVGEPVFLGDAVRRATLKGFFSALAVHPACMPAGFADDFLAFAAGFDEGQMLEIMVHMLDAWPPGPSEAEMILINLPSHCVSLTNLLNSQDSPDFY